MDNLDKAIAEVAGLAKMANCSNCKSYSHFMGSLWICEKKYKSGITTIGSIVKATETCDKHEIKS